MAKKQLKLVSFRVHYDAENRETGWGFVTPDLTKLMAEVESSINEYLSQGWTITSIQPILRGIFFSKDEYEGGLGYSLTDCILVFLEKA